MMKNVRLAVRRTKLFQETYLVYYDVKEEKVVVANEVDASKKLFSTVEIKVPCKVVSKGRNYSPRCWVEVTGQLLTFADEALIK